MILLMLWAVAAGAAGCSWSATGPESAFEGFAHAVQGRNAEAAAAETDDPAAAQPPIRSMLDGMGADARVGVSVGDVRDDGDTAHTTLAYTWSFGGDREFRYDAEATASRADGRWRVDWSPTVLHPKLRPGLTFRFSDDKDLLTPIVDRDGQPLMDWQTVGLVTLDRAHRDSAAALADVLGRFDTVSADSIQAQFGAGAPGDDEDAEDTVTVMTLRRADLDQVSAQLDSIPGVAVRRQGALLTANPQLSSPVIDGLKPLWQRAIDATAGWSVALVSEDGSPAEELTSTPARDTPPIRTTIDTRMQLLAQQAVATDPRPTVLVALSTTTGGILAIAQNDAADAQGPISVTGLYPPGSTFKTITTAAAMQAGLVTPDTAVQCPGQITIENRTIPNEDEFDLGTVPLREAFAHSCNTTMARLADQLSPDALGRTARMFGIGVDYVIPGLTTVTGRVPDADTPAQRVENGIGQGTVTVSPFGLAVAEASLGHGSTVIPTLVIGDAAGSQTDTQTGSQTRADADPQTIPTDVAAGLREMMRLTVSEGTATELADIDGLGGKTGTAEYGDNTHSHGWFAGIAADVAFATLVVGGDSSAPAVEVSGAFLRPMLAG
ncbi:penicillin-binding transpeptidase domain-containing protein [Mycolicibacterium palauense]|uniref:penicillin-binding transpeptidase domain-containing protein n=1 Tax=Mycolicibacterium palauense TaxID=2034511 RepID=UPI0038994AC7